MTNSPPWTRMIRYHIRKFPRWVREVHEFAYSDQLPYNFAITIVASIHRWRMVRCLYIDRAHDTLYKDRIRDSVGPAKGMRACIKRALLILPGELPVATQIFRCAENGVILRIRVLRSFLRTVVYLCDRQSRATSR